MSFLYFYISVSSSDQVKRSPHGEGIREHLIVGQKVRVQQHFEGYIEGVEREGGDVQRVGTGVSDGKNQEGDL